jgi:hypothetical protein
VSSEQGQAGRRQAGGRSAAAGLRAAGCGQREMENVGEEDKEEEEKRGSGWASGQVSEWVGDRASECEGQRLKTQASGHRAIRRRQIGCEAGEAGVAARREELPALSRPPGHAARVEAGGVDRRPSTPGERGLLQSARPKRRRIDSHRPQSPQKRPIAITGDDLAACIESFWPARPSRLALAAGKETLTRRVQSLSQRKSLAPPIEPNWRRPTIAATTTTITTTTTAYHRLPPPPWPRPHPPPPPSHAPEATRASSSNSRSVLRRHGPYSAPPQLTRP